MYNRKNETRLERIQQKNDAGHVSAHYPDVESIVINMIYSQRGMAKPIHRIVNFFPGSHAFFRIDCLSRDCIDGGFDLTHVIEGMVRNHSGSYKGEITCESSQPQTDHSNIAYEVNIQYSP